MPLYEIIPLEAVVGTCCVLDLYTFCKGETPLTPSLLWVVSHDHPIS